MSFFAGILMLLNAVMLVLGAFPVALMACGFAADSGKCSTARFWTIFVVTVVGIVALAGTIGWSGWQLLG